MNEHDEEEYEDEEEEVEEDPDLEASLMGEQLTEAEIDEHKSNAINLTLDHLSFLAKRFGLEAAVSFINTLFTYQQEITRGFMGESLAAEVDAAATGEDPRVAVSRATQEFFNKRMYQNLVDAKPAVTFPKGTKVQKSFIAGVVISEPDQKFFVKVVPYGDQNKAHLIEDALVPILEKFVETD